MLPHASWIYLPSGKFYTLSERPGVAGVVGANNQGRDVNQWLEDPWLVSQSYQRHLLQVMFLDRLVGELVRRLREQNLYDSTLLVLTADHGASFRPGDSRRLVTGTNFMDIISVPLIVKAPGQQEGVVSDRNVESMDILPTLVEMLGVETDWPLEGRSALAAAAPERPEKIVFGDDGEKHTFDSRLESRWKSLDRKLALFGATNGDLSERDLYRIGPHAELVGERTDTLVRGKSDLVVEIDGSHLFRQVELDSPFLLSRISGRVLGSRDSPIGRTLAIGVNGAVCAVTQTSHLDGETVFSAVVPETAFREGSNRIRIYETRKTGSGPALLPAGIPDPATYRLEAAGEESLLVTPEEKKIPIGDRGVTGWVVSRLESGPEPDLHRRMGRRRAKSSPATSHPLVSGRGILLRRAHRKIPERCGQDVRQLGNRPQRLPVRILPPRLPRSRRDGDPGLHPFPGRARVRVQLSLPRRHRQLALPAERRLGAAMAFANLTDAALIRVDLTGARLEGAKLEGADLRGSQS